MAGMRIGLPLKYAAAVVALFPDARNTLIGKYGLHPNRVVVIPNAVDPARIHQPKPDLANARSRLGLDTSPVTKWVGYIGALSEEKRVHLAVEAVAAREDWGLLIAGDGPEESWLKSLAAYLAPQRIRFLGRRSELSGIYDLMDVLVLPSRTEGVPAVALEAAMKGVPVVATNVGGVGEVMANGVTGVLVDDASATGLTAALASILDDPRESPPDLGSQTRHLADYDIVQVARAWDDLIATAARARRVPGRPS